MSISDGEEVEVRRLTIRKRTPIVQIAWNHLQRVVKRNKAYSLIACVLCICSVVAWAHFWMAIPYNFRLFIYCSENCCCVDYSITILGFIALAAVFSYEYLTTYGLVSLLPAPVKDSVKSYLFDKSLVDIITQDSWIKGFLADVFAALFVELDEDEIQRIFQRMPAPLQTAVTQRGVLHLTPSSLRSLILPREQWPAQKGNLPILRKPSEQHLDQMPPHSSSGLGRRCLSCGSFSHFDDDESKLEHPSLPSPSSFEQSFPSEVMQASPAAARSPTTMYRRSTSTTRRRKSAAPKNVTISSSSSTTLQSSSHKFRRRPTAPATSASSHSKPVRSLSPLRRRRPGVLNRSQTLPVTSISAASSPRASRVVGVPREGVFSILDARVKQSFETAVRSYVTEPVNRVSDAKLRVMALTTGASVILMLKRSRTVRQAATQGTLVTVYVVTVLLFAFSFGVLHSRNSAERRRIIRYSKFAAFRYAQLQNAYVRAKNSRPATAVSKVAKSRITHGIIVAVPIVYGVFKLVRNRDLRMMIGVS